MTFLDECRASRAAGGADPDESQTRVLREWLTSRPEALFDELREHAPTLVLGRMALVTRHADVMDVLGRSDIFSVKPYGTAMMRINRGPNFLLGMDDGPEYRDDVARLGRIFRHDDRQRIEEFAQIRTMDALARARSEGHLDLTDDFGRLVPSLFIGDYFGISASSPETLMTWARDIFTDGFANVLGIPLLSRRAMRASDAFRAHLDALIMRARSSAADDDDDNVLARLLAMQPSDAALTDSRVRDTLLWCAAGMVDNVNTAVCCAIDYLLGQPSALAGAVEAAQAGDVAQLNAHVLEALRFRTPTPVVTRLAMHAHTMSAGTRNETTIAAGTLVFAGLGAAMMDASVVESPREFRLGRPADHYLHFGAGLHRCAGRQIAMVLVTTMVGRVVMLPGLRRARGVTGRLRILGAFPRAFVIECERG